MNSPADRPPLSFAEASPASPAPPLHVESTQERAATRQRQPFIYIACPWGPMGGGMYKVADYLVQAQAAQTPERSAQLRVLDTRGPGSAVASLWALLRALTRLAKGRASGDLVGVHVNMAEKLSLFRKGCVVVASHTLGLPVVIHLHAQMQRFYGRLPAPLRALTRWMFSLARCVLVIGPAGQRFVTEELGVRAERVQIVINGVPGVAQARPQPASAAVRRVLFIGRLSALKGVPDLLQAVSRLGAARDRMVLTLAGDGDLPACRALASELGIETVVRFEGWCDQQRIHSLLREADILVLPSYDEVMPLVILEALAHGAAVVCTPVGEIPSVLTDGLDARFVTPGDVDALARALRTLIEQPAQLEELRRNGRALYLAQFSIARFFEQVALVHQRHFGMAATLPGGGTAQEGPR